MRLILSAVALGFIVACSAETTVNTAPIEATAPSEDARIVAALSYADWCSSCRALDPKITEARADGDPEGVHFVVLDYSSRDADAFFAGADTAGIGEALRGHYADGVKTGRMILVDLEAGTVVGEISKDMSVAEIRTALDRAAT
ncbi:MAG: hypothetical protein AAF829_00840 [Pseudomonadota bacterium]